MANNDGCLAVNVVVRGKFVMHYAGLFSPFPMATMSINNRNNRSVPLFQDSFTIA